MNQTLIDTLRGFLKCHEDNLKRVEGDLAINNKAITSIKESITEIKRKIAEAEKL